MRVYFTKRVEIKDEIRIVDENWVHLNIVRSKDRKIYLLWLNLVKENSSCEWQQRNRVVHSCNILGDHLSGKPGNVREFDSCQGNVRDFTKSQGGIREKNLVREKQTRLHLLLLVLSLTSDINITERLEMCYAAAVLANLCWRKSMIYTIWFSAPLDIL